jgi:hypothetical protein
VLRARCRHAAESVSGGRTCYDVVSRFQSGQSVTVCAIRRPCWMDVAGGEGASEEVVVCLGDGQVAKELNRS